MRQEGPQGGNHSQSGKRMSDTTAKSKVQVGDGVGGVCARACKRLGLRKKHEPHKASKTSLPKKGNLIFCKHAQRLWNCSPRPVKQDAVRVPADSSRRRNAARHGHRCCRNNTTSRRGNAGRTLVRMTCTPACSGQIESDSSKCDTSAMPPCGCSEGDSFSSASGSVSELDNTGGACVCSGTANASAGISTVDDCDFRRPTALSKT